MRDLSQRIYDALRHTLITHEMIAMRALETAVGVKERGLQASDGEPGPLDIASEEIFVTYGMCIITKNGSGGGVKLTNDQEEIQNARDHLARHVWNEKRRVDRYESYIKRLRQRLQPSSQLSLEIH